MTEETELTPRERVLAWMAAHRVTVEAEFIPYSRSRNAKPRPGSDKPWPSLNWTVTVKRNGRDVLATDYSAGKGYAPASKASAEKVKRAATFYGRSDQVTRQEMIAWEIENGRAVSSASMQGFSGREPLKPDACDVLNSLVSDASVLDAAGFEDWASEFGYDPDSRAAEATYRACLEIALQLRNGVGADALAELQRACEGY